MPKIARATSVRPAPTRPARATISPGPLLEADIPENSVPATAPNTQNRLADFRRRLGKQFSDIAPNLFTYDLLNRHVRGDVGGYVGSVAHDGD